MKEILDTRFFIEHFFSSDAEVLERTRKRIRDLRRRGDGVVPVIVVAEFVDQACRRAGRREAREKAEAILQSGLAIEPLRPAVALAAGALRCSHRGVPMADCVIAATADEVRGRVVSDDPHFRQLKGVRVAWL